MQLNGEDISHSILNVKYSVKRRHSWLPRRRNKLSGKHIFSAQRYKTHFEGGSGESWVRDERRYFDTEVSPIHVIAQKEVSSRLWVSALLEEFHEVILNVNI